MVGFILATGAVVVTGAVFGSMYNGLVRLRNQVDNAFAGVDVQLKKRYDLIPNLVETVKTFMGHERSLLEDITKLRTQAVSQNLGANEKVALENELSASMGKLLVSVENYPELKSNENFIHLQGSFNEVESQISAARRAYNASVTDYNIGIETFPRNLLAGMMGMARKEVFVATTVERNNVSAKALFA